MGASQPGLRQAFSRLRSWLMLKIEARLLPDLMSSCITTGSNM